MEDLQCGEQRSANKFKAAVKADREKAVVKLLKRSAPIKTKHQLCPGTLGKVLWGKDPAHQEFQFERMKICINGEPLN